jgi:hypothetical protein
MIKDDKVGIGYGMLGLFQDPRFVSFDGKEWMFHADTFRAHIRKIARRGANFIRILAWAVWGPHKYGKLSQFQAFMLKKISPTVELWDLSKPNAYYLPIVTQAIKIAKEEGLTTIFDWLDNCEFHGAVKKWSPWMNNVQGITSFYGKDADKYTKPLMTVTANLWKKLGVIFGMNEANNRQFPAMYERVVVPVIKSTKLPFSQLTYGATDDAIQDAVRDIAKSKFGAKASKEIILEYHGFPFPAALPNAARVMCSDNGFYEGLPSCDGDPRGYRPSPAQFEKAALNILKKYPDSAPGRPRLLSFEHLPAGGDYDDPDCQALWFEGISRAYKKRFGVWPYNYKLD